MKSLTSIIVHFTRLTTVVALVIISDTVAVQTANAQCETKLLASDGDLDDFFGYSVSISGDLTIIGASQENDYGFGSGSVYIYRYYPQGPGHWVEEAKLRASDGGLQDIFGCSVSIDGDVAVIGAFGDHDNGFTSGSAYIFRYDHEGSEQWVEEAKLLASDGAYNDRFGHSVYISDDVAVIGAHLDDDNGTDSGSVYIYRYNQDGLGQWIEEAKIVASDGSEYDLFGKSVSISGDVIVIGSGVDDDNGNNSGSAYIFRYDRNGTKKWIEEAKLIASDGAINERFGCSVSISGDVVLIGALYDDDNRYKSGSAYIFRYDPDSPQLWIEEAKLLASDGFANQHFGGSTAINGDVAVVGTIGNNVNGYSSGSAYTFRYNSYGSKQWVEETKLLASDGDDNDYFSRSISINGNVVVIGAYGNDDNHEDTGSAYIYDFNCPSLTISPMPLIAGWPATFTATGLNPNAETFLAYSTTGYGHKYIKQLNIKIDIMNASRIQGMKVSDSTGNASAILQVPLNAAGRNIWFQACQFELKTNVVTTNIQ